MLFNKTIKNIKRIRQVVQILVKYGFEDVVANTVLIKLVPRRTQLSWKRKDRPVFDYTRWERIRMVFEELGATFIKLAQVLSDRPDILPEPLIKEFQKLQSHVPPFEYNQVEAIIQTETGKKIEDIYDWFDKETIGSASIGQVHRAKLKTGEHVVVKVQRPGVRELVDTDLRILKDFVKRSESYFEKNGITNLTDIVNTFDKTMHKELDYNHEARNIEQFRLYYKRIRKFYVPRAYKNYTTEKVLVVEYAEGCKITDLKQLQEWNINLGKLAENGMHIYLTQIFEHGFFHADPHPGNIIVKRDGTICLIDFGMVGKLMKRDKYAIAGIFIGMAQKNPEKMASNLRKLSFKNNITDRRIFENDVNEIIEDFASLDVSEGSMADLLPRLQKLVYDYNMQLPGSMFLILRALAILEGIGKTVHPSMNIYDFLKPYGAKIVREQYSVENISEEIVDRVLQFNTFVRNFPIEINEVLRNVREGKLHIEVEDKGNKNLAKKIDKAANRFLTAVIIAALLISASLTLNFEMTSGVENSHYLSYTQLALAVLLSLYLLVSIVKSKSD